MKAKLIILLLFIASMPVTGQTKLADKFFERYAYIKASELYEEAVENGDDSKHVLTKLGDCYYNNSNAEKAAKWYKMAIDKYDDLNAEYIYKYIQTQRSLGNFEEANSFMAKFKLLREDDSRSGHLLENLETYDELTSTEGIYVKLNNLDINSEYSDFGSLIHEGVFYFASARNAGNKVYSWNEQPYLDIYEALVRIEGDSVILLDADFIKADDINTDYHEASVSITKDGNTIYFTRDNVTKRNKLDYDKKGTSHLRIYKATRSNEGWTDIVDLPFNDDVYSTGHPALNADESRLYFVSDRDGGEGQTDIYYVDILENGEYGEPQNLGPKVNTEGKELFPFIDENNKLYFTSDGHLNIGLLDIFMSDILNDENAIVKNMGAPYNSGADDFAYYKDKESGIGFFSSNRSGGMGNDDIYSFSEYECKQIVSGIVRDSVTGNPLTSAIVQKIDAGGMVVETLTTGPDGSYSFEVDCDKKYTILGRKQDYKDKLEPLQTTKENGFSHKIDLNLIPLIKDDQIVINPIFFDFDKWNIRTDAKYELENIVDVMRQHPEMIIKIESHTDSRGSDRYNMKLSDRRAKSTRDYILSRGIAKNRIQSAIGYGESQLLNECSDGVRCSEAKHQENRRSYFYIVKKE